LNAIAQVRAQTIAARISANTLHPGHPRVSRAATTIAAIANGRAKIVWLNFTNSAHFRTVAIDLAKALTVGIGAGDRRIELDIVRVARNAARS
jgi:hypothetical protein